MDFSNKPEKVKTLLRRYKETETPITHSVLLQSTNKHKKLGFDPSDVIDKTSLAGKMQSALLPYVGYVDKTILLNYAKKFKLPLAATVGIATVAGLAYLAYRIWKSRQNGDGETEKENSLSAIMSDIKAAIPDIVNIPGWETTVAEKVYDILSNSDHVDIPVRISELKSQLMNKQAEISPPPNIGEGLLLREIARSHTIHGKGIIKTLY